MNEEFECEGFWGKIKAKGTGALILSCAGAVFLIGGGVYLLTRNKAALETAQDFAINLMDMKK